MYSETICEFSVTVTSISNILGEFLNVVTWLTLDLVLYLCVPFLALLMSIFACFSPQVSHGEVVLVYPLLFFKSHFWKSPIFGVTVKSWLLIGWKNSIFLGSLVGVHLGIPIK